MASVAKASPPSYLWVRLLLQKPKIGQPISWQTGNSILTLTRYTYVRQTASVGNGDDIMGQPFVLESVRKE